MPRNTALIDYLKTRRSVGLAFLDEPGPSPAELEEILTIGTRVPDHGKFTPWRLVVIDGDARAQIGERLANIARVSRADMDEVSLDIERRRLLPAPVSIAVIFSPRPHPKAPELEQLLSAGNVCFNLCHAAFALGYGATWVTRWFSFDVAAQQVFGVRGGERMVGLVHIGTPRTVPEDRDRPKLADVVTHWSAD